ncbi:hypothetical protein [Teichococcus vastitatis]|uniref:Uncharacterized protein n=1 Tax=Teichococcus vastitatis TaxID=2307076 RepID=A0ABS9VZP3_9PROT|nr:hypothetical protein [Pseudoroseomonas vastitatis]MCI0752472.1 hypothetical protein [Pseudoroseomonas vastitatis]
MTESAAPRRIAPQTGPHLWSGATLSPADWMMPLGAGAGAEIEAALASPGGPLPLLAPMLAQVIERLSHGQGFCLLRGLPHRAEPHALLGLLGSRIGRPVATTPADGPFQAEPCDVLLLLCRQGCVLALHSAAALHNALLKSDRATLEALYQPQPHEPAVPVFAVHQGAFAAWPAPASAALRDAAEDAALSIPLHPGDLLCLNPFLVWASPAAGLAALPLITEPSRLTGPFAALMPAAAG